MKPLPLVFTLELPEATPSNNTIKSMHFRAYKKTREAWQMMVQAAASGAPRPAIPVQRAFIAIERYSSGGGLDWDNAYGGLKPLLDCLVVPSDRNPSGLGLIVDDNPRNMPLPPFIRQLPAKRGEGRTIVRIYDAQGVETAPETWLSQLN